MRLRIILLILIGIFLYIPSLFGPFIWDDEDFIYANQYVKECRVDKFFDDSVTAGRGKVSNYYRPIQLTVYCVTNTVFGENPFWFHFVNILVHIGAAITVFIFLNKLTANRSPLTALFISIIFLIHPVQTEAVSYISGLSDPLYVLFGFLSLIFFLRKKTLFSLIFFSLSLLSKETGIVFFGIISLLSVIPAEAGIYLNRPRIKSGMTMLVPYLIVVSVYLLFHFTTINHADMKTAWGANSLYANSLMIRLATFIQNLPTYFSLLIFPKDLFMERDYTVDVATSFLPQILIFLGTNAAFLSLLFKIIKRPGDRVGLLFFYSSFWISFIPYSGAVLINGIFYEHFLYLPMIWFFGFWVFFIYLVIPAREPGCRIYLYRFRVKSGMTILVTVFLILLSLRNLSRQLDWTDSVRFYKQTLAHAPKSVRINNGLAMAYAEKGENDKALEQYKKTIVMSPNVPNLYHNLANLYSNAGDYTKAEENYLKAIEVDPNFFYSVQSLYNLYKRTNQKERLDEFVKKYKMGY